MNARRRTGFRLGLFAAFFGPCALLAPLLAAGPAVAQMMPTNPVNPISAAPPRARAQQHETAPPALPGAVPSPSSANTHIQATGNPTADLFSAIDRNDYASAQDAIARGADLGERNQFGETPLDLAVDLNRTQIMFLLLGSRAADSGGGGGGGGPVSGAGMAAAIPAAARTGRRMHPVMAPAGATSGVSGIAPAAPPAPGPTGTPNAAAGFLGFGQK